MRERFSRPDRGELIRAAWRFTHPEDYVVKGRLVEQVGENQMEAVLAWVPQAGGPSVLTSASGGINLTDTHEWDKEVLRQGMWFEDPCEDDIEYFALRVLACFVKK